MTFEVPKISGNEYGLFSKNIFMQGVQKKPVSFGGSGSVFSGANAGGLRKDLDEIAGFGAQKADNSTTMGLHGAPTPDAGTGQKLWGYC